MGGALSKVFNIMMIALLILITLYQNYKFQDDLVYQNTYKATTNFTEAVRNKGYVTPDMYSEFSKEIRVGTYAFEIQIEHQRKTYTPLLTDVNDPNSFNGQYRIDYEKYYTKQIEDYLFSDTNPLPLDERIYKLQADDYFIATVKNKKNTNADIVFNFLTGNSKSDSPSRIFVKAGGMVLNEDY